MLFFEYKFLFIFFPICFSCYLLCLNYKKTLLIPWLSFSSVIFYSVWDYRNILPLFASITINYFFGRHIANNRNERKRSLLFFFGILFNLLLLIFYKYASFLMALSFKTISLAES